MIKTRKSKKIVSNKKSMLAMAVAATIGVAGWASSAHAGLLYWSGTGTWANSGGTSWGTISGVDSGSAWSNGSDAVFEGAAGTVSVTTQITNINSMAFTTDGYTLSGNSGTLTLTGTGGNITTGSGTDTIGANTSLIIGGSVGLTKYGSGTLTVNGTTQNSFTGGLIVNAGTFNLDYVNYNANNLVGSGNVLTLGGGTLRINGNSTGNTGQTFASLTLNAGANAISLVSPTGNTNTLTFTSSTITRATGAVITFTKPANTVIALNPTLAGTIVGPWAFVLSTGTAANGTAAGYNYATTSASNIVAYTAATAETSTGSGFGIAASGITTNSVTNYDVSSAGTIASAGSVRSVNTIRYTGTGFTITAGGAAGWVMNGFLNAGSGSAVINATISAGANKELVLAGANAGITVSGAISDWTGTGAGASAVTIMGSSTVTLSGTNLYTGQTYLNSGVLNITADASLGAVATNANLNINGGTLQFATGFTLDNGANKRPIVLGPSGGTIDTQAVNPTIDGVISSVGNLTKIGTGNLTLSGTDTYSGQTFINAGTLTLAATGTIANTSAISIGTGSTSATFNPSAAGTFTAPNLFAQGSGTATFTGAATSSGKNINMQNNNIGILNFSSTLTVNNDTLFFDLGPATGTSDVINVTGAVTSTGTNYINVAALTTDTSLNTGNTAYTLLTATGGGLATNFTLSSSTIVVGSNTYNLSLSNSTSGTEFLSVTSAAIQQVTWATAASGTWQNPDSTNWVLTSNHATTATYADGNIVTFDNTPGGTSVAVTIGGSVAPASVTFANSTVAYTFSGSSGITAGSVTVSGGGSVTFGEANTYTGATNISNGTLTLTAAGAINGSAISVSSTGQLIESIDNAITGSSSLTISGPTVTLGNANNYTGITSITSGTLALTAAGAINGSAITVSGTGNLTESGLGTITGASSLTVNGPSVTLSGANSYTGLTLLTTGTLALSGTNSAGAGATTINGGVLQLNNTGANNGGLAGGTVSLNAGVIDNITGGALTLASNNAVTLGGNFGFSTAAGNANNNLSFGTGAVTITGSRTIALNPTTAATLTFGGTATNNTNAAITTTVNGGVAGDTLSLGAFVLNSGAATVTDIFTGSGKINITGNITNGGAGANGLTYSGTNTLTLSGTNSFTGLVTVNSGSTIKLGSSTALGSGAGANVVASGGTLDLGGQTITNPVTISGTGVGGNGALINSSGSLATDSGAISVTAGGAFTIGGLNNITLSGAISSTANFTVTKIGAGTLTLSGGADNGFLALIENGGTTILGKNPSTGAVHSVGSGITITTGTVQLGGSGGDQIVNTNVVTVNGGTFDLNALSESIGGLAGTGGTVLNNNNAAVSTLTVGNATGSGAGTYSGTVADGSGVLALSKGGTGVMVLSGNNTYSGGTTITAGTLQVTNVTSTSATGAGAVKVATGATLAGSGTVNQGFISGTVNVDGGGKITGSNGTTLTVGSLALNDTGNATSGTAPLLNFALSGTPNGINNPSTTAFIYVTNSGGLTVGSTHNTTITFTGTPQPGTYDLIGYTGLDPGTTNFNPIANLNGFSFTLQDNSGQIDVLSQQSALTWKNGGTSPSSWDTNSSNFNWADSTPSAQPYSDGALVTFQDQNAITSTNLSSPQSVVVQTAGVNPFSVTFANTTAVEFDLSDQTGTTGIAGITSVTKSGNGIVALNGGNSYTGGTIMSAGTLVLGNVASLGTVATDVLTLNGGTVDMNFTGTGTTYNTTIGSGSPTIVSDAQANAGAALTYTLGTLSIGGGNQLNITAANVSTGTPGIGFGVTTLTGSATLNTSSANLTLASLNTGTGNTLTINATAPFATTVSGLTTVQGATTFATNTGNLNLTTMSIGAFTLTTSSTGAFGTSVSGLTTVTGNATFNTSSANLTLSTLSIGALTLGATDTTTSFGFGTTVTGTTTVTASGALFNPTTANLSLNGVTGTATNITLEGSSTGSSIGAISTTSGTVTVSGGTWKFTGTGTYTGATSFTAGTVTVGANNPFGTTGTLTLGGTGIVLQGDGVSLHTIGDPVSLAPGGGFPVTIAGSSALTFNGTYINSQSGTAPVLVVNNTAATNFNGVWTISNATTSRNDLIEGSGNVVINNVIQSGGVAAAATQGIVYEGTGTLTLSASSGGTVNGVTTATSLTSIQIATGAVPAIVDTVPATSQGNSTLQISGNYTIGTSGIVSLTIKGGTGVPVTGTTQGTLSLVDGTINTLTINSSAAASTVLTMAGAASNPSVLNLEYNPQAGGQKVDLIALGSGQKMTVNAGEVVIGLTNIGTGSLAIGNYNLLTFASGSTFTGTPFSFSGGPVIQAGGGLGYSLSAVNGTSTSEQLVVAQNAAPANAYWAGTADSNWNTLGSTNNVTNWRTAATGTTDTFQLPGSTTNIHFYNSNASAFTTTLGQNFTINSLAFDNGGSGVTIDGSANILTINTSGTGISMASTAGNDIITANVAVALGASQAWTNSTASNTLTVNGGISNAAGTVGTQTLTLTAGKINLGGTIADNAGTLALSVTGATATLGGTNTYTGTTTLTSGTLIGASAQPFGTVAAPLQLNGGTLDLANGTVGAFTAYNTTVGGTPVTIQSDNATSSAGVTYTLGTLSIGTDQLNIQHGTNSDNTAAVAFGATTLTGNATFNATTANLTLASVTGTHNMTLTGSSTGNVINGAITTGSGTVTVSGGTWQYAGTTNANTNTGLTTVSGGELDLNKTAGTNAIAGNQVTVSGGTLKLLASNQIVDTAVISVSSGTLNFNNFDETIADIVNTGGTVNYGNGTITTTDPSWESGTNTVPGTLNTNTLNVSGGTNTITGTVNLGASGTGTLDFGGSSSPNITITSPGTLKFTNIAGTIKTDTFTDSDANVIPALSGSASISGTGSVDLNGQSANFNIGTSGQTLNISAAIIDSVGGGSVTKSGSGTLALSGANTYSGTTAVNNGTLKANAVNTLSSSSDVTIGGGTLDVSSFANTVNSLTMTSGALSLGINGDTPVALTSNGAITFSGGTINIATSGSQTLGLYTLATGTSVSGGFTQGSVPSGYAVVENVTPNTLDLQHLATATISVSAPTRYLISTTDTGGVSGTVTNTAPAGSASLAVNLTDGSGTLLSSGFTGYSSPVTPTNSTGFTADFTTTGSTGNQTIKVTETDSGNSVSVTSSPFTVDVVAPRTYTQSGITLGGNTLLAGQTVSGNATVDSSDADNVATRETLNLAAAGPNGNGVSVGTAGPVAFAGANSLSTTVSALLGYSGSSSTIGNVVNTSNEAFAYTKATIGGIQYTINASGNATTDDADRDATNMRGILPNTADRLAYQMTEYETGSQTLFNAPALTANVLATHSYAGLASKTSGALTLDESAPLGTEAKLLAGVSTNGNTVSMTWRDRSAIEQYVGSVPPLPNTNSGLVSDVVLLTGMGNSTGTFTDNKTIDANPYSITNYQTDDFVLQMSYSGSFNTTATLDWLDPSDSTWKLANAGDTIFGDLNANTATGGELGYSGDFASFQGAHGATLANYLGAYGEFTGNGTDGVLGVNYVWAVIDHNSQFAVDESFSVVPEPTSLGLLGLGAMGLLARRRRRA